MSIYHILFEKVFSFLMLKLENELPSNLKYHNPAHTKNVIEAVIELAGKEAIEEGELLLLKTSALFHDSGFMVSHENHEEHSIAFARKFLPDFGYSAIQIDRIYALILSTRLPHTLFDPLSSYICDADLYYLGGHAYKFYANELYKELNSLAIIQSKEEWHEIQIDFLRNHRYQTKTAQNERNGQKQANLQELLSTGVL